MSRFGLTKGVRGLLLDAGNTLVFLDMEAVAETVHAVGLALSVERLQAAEVEAKRAYMGLMATEGDHEAGWDRFMSALLQCAGASGDQVSGGVQALREEQRRFNLWRKVPAGLVLALKSAREGGLRLGVLSNSEGRIAELLQRVGLAAYFEVIVDSAVVGVAKPDPAIFALAARQLGLPPDELVYVGDIPDVDVLGAQQAGLQAVLIDPFDHFPHFTASARCASVAEVIADLLR